MFMRVESVGPYRLLQRIGRGGMAEVYLAEAYGASGFQKRVALKRLLPALRTNAELERLLIEEAKLGARLSHRNLVHTLDLGIHEGSYYAVLEHVEGADLLTLTKDHALPAPLAWLVLEELATALAYLHQATDEAGRPLGLVHRDVSPSNVLVSRAGEVKLSDLGIAKATMLLEDTRPNVRKGKYAYMSPEQVAQQPLSGQSDQFALGVTAVELLTRQRPFDGETVPATMDNISRATPPPLSAESPEDRALIWRCLAKNPGDRFPNTSALVRAIAERRRQLPWVGSEDLAAWVRGASRPGIGAG